MTGMMRMSKYQEAFQLLQLDITTDKRAIRHAYASLVKRHHPEEDPEGWEMLHRAYETALAYAEREAGPYQSREQEPVRIVQTPLGTGTGSETENREEHEYREVEDFFQKRTAEQEIAYDSEEKLVLTRLQSMQDTQSVLSNDWYRVYEMPEMNQVRTSYAVLREIQNRLQTELPPKAVCKFLSGEMNKTAHQIQLIPDQETRERLFLLVWEIDACLRENGGVQETGTDDTVKARRIDLVLYLVIAGALVFGFFGFMMVR